MNKKIVRIGSQFRLYAMRHRLKAELRTGHRLKAELRTGHRLKAELRTGQKNKSRGVVFEEWRDTGRFPVKLPENKYRRISDLLRLREQD